jgi:hopene-associated glycosyltransferase HpnB
MINLAIGVATLVVWAALLIGRGRFWRSLDLYLPTSIPGDDKLEARWPRIVAVVPARDEADMIADSVADLVRQRYSGSFSVVVVDDQSSDGTAATALGAANAAAPDDGRRQPSFLVIEGGAPPAGWTGKVWSMQQGFAAALSAGEPPEYILFMDADISLTPDILRRLVALAETRRAVLVSLMVKLRCESQAEKWLVPAFVFFFQLLYPFHWANDPRRRTAAAAGGCMLVHCGTLAAAGGLEPLKSALIDDCALAVLMKRQGPIWLGLTKDASSRRAYPKFSDFGRMVARSAFAELHFSGLRLGVAVAGMALVFAAPPLVTLFAQGWARAAGALAWAMMTLAFTPTLRLYGRPLVVGLALPVVAIAYVIFTLQSAAQYWRGRGGLWKGRFQAPLAKVERV